jgi:hypothetical protein
MSRRCKPGIRARIIRGGNQGKIVVVVRRYFGEIVSGGPWPRELLFPWVVTSLSGPLRFVHLETGKEAVPSMTIVAEDSALEPLRDDDEDDTANEGVPATNLPEVRDKRAVESHKIASVHHG